jgi:SAM-dependent methyltransferase
MGSTPATQFVADIPRYYDTHLGPILFEDYAVDLARRAAALETRDVLELAAGTGISTVALRNALPKSTRIVATDLNTPMLEIARAKLPSTANVDFREADATALPFEDGSFDLVVIQFGVMFFPDRPAAYAEARRVLRPSGTLLFNAWSTMAANPFAEITNANAIRFFPDDPPQFYLTPFGYADIAHVRADLARAGFTEVDHEVVRIDKRVLDWTHFARGIIYGNPIIADIRATDVDPEDTITAIAADLRARFGPAPARMPLEATVYTARKA